MNKTIGKKALNTALMLVLTLVMTAGGMMPFGVIDSYAAETGNVSYRESPYGNQLLFFDMDRKPVYCAEQRKGDLMNNISYSLGATNASDYETKSTADSYWDYTKYWRNGQNHWDKIKRILYVGYPVDAAGYGNGVDPNVFRAATQEAIWYYTDSQSPSIHPEKAYELINDKTTVPDNVVLKFWTPNVQNNPPYQSVFSLEKGGSIPVIQNTTANANNIEATETAPATVSVASGAQISVTVKDKVTLKGIDKDYKLVSKLYKKGGTEPVQTKVTSIGASSHSEITVQFDTALSETGNYYIKTQLFDKDATVYPDSAAITTHNSAGDMNREAVLIQQDEPAPTKSLRTTVKNGEDSASSSAPLKLKKTDDGKYTFTDVIEYEGLTSGATYTVSGNLVTKPDGPVIGTAQNEFTASESGSGSWSLTFEVTGLEVGKEYVVFETAKNNSDDSDTVSHQDINDKSQTLIVEEETPAVHPIKISKKALGGSEVTGAAMKLSAADGAEIETWTSTTEAKELSVAAGSYSLEETAAPEGFRRVTTIIGFTVDEEGKVSLITTTVDNGGRVSLMNGDHIVLENAPDDPDGDKDKDKDKDSGKVTPKADGSAVQKSSKKGVETGDDSPLALAVIAFFGAAGAFELMRRRRAD